MPIPMTPQDLAHRLEDLSAKKALNPDETRELQSLARQAADMVCAVEGVKEKRHGGRD